MTLPALDGLLWLVICLLPFLLVQRLLHRQIQVVFLILTRSPSVSLGLFSLLFFPGVLLHETSHYLMALFLRVKTGGFSLLPHLQPDGQLRLGYVETVPTDFVRDALIGSAPLITGALTIAYLGTYHLGLVPLLGLISQADWNTLSEALALMPQQVDFWLWFYLAFTVSSMMLPSASDRRAWLPITLVIVLLVGLAALAGAGPWMLANMAPWLNQALRAVGLVFGMSLVLHLVLLIPFAGIRVLLSKLTGLQVA
jgi:hypothetical protein